MSHGLSLKAMQMHRAARRFYGQTTRFRFIRESYSALFLLICPTFGWMAVLASLIGWVNKSVGELEAIAPCCGAG